MVFTEDREGVELLTEDRGVEAVLTDEGGEGLGREDEDAEGVGEGLGVLRSTKLGLSIVDFDPPKRDLLNLKRKNKVN